MPRPEVTLTRRYAVRKPTKRGSFVSAVELPADIYKRVQSVQEKMNQPPHRVPFRAIMEDAVRRWLPQIEEALSGKGTKATGTYHPLLSPETCDTVADEK